MHTGLKVLIDGQANLSPVDSFLALTNLKDSVECAALGVDLLG
jgi:hypothetical protein